MKTLKGLSEKLTTLRKFLLVKSTSNKLSGLQRKKSKKVKRKVKIVQIVIIHNKKL